MNRSEKFVELIRALNKCQSEIRGAIKDTKNAYFNNSKYADLASVWDAIRDPMTKAGLAVTQTTEMIEGKLYLTTTLFHISGEWISGLYPIKPMMQKKDVGWVDTENPQAMGSCITYARRYALMAIIGIAPEDDDGNAASGHESDKKAVEVKSEPKPSQNGKSTETIVSAVTEQVVELLMDLCPNVPEDQEDLLESLSSFSGEDGVVKGKRNVKELSEGRLKVVLGKLREEKTKRDKVKA